MSRLLVLAIFYFLTVSSAQPAEPQSQSATSDEELVKQTQNPVANLISVPFQNNFNFAAGPKHNHQIYLLNIQPVIPIHLSENWNLIARIITPVINLPSLAPGIGSAAGLGDINPTFFLSPAKSGELIWGLGPTFTLPTASDKLLGNGKFSLGPAAVALMMKEQWVFGALMNYQWSVAGWTDGHVSQTLIQPFVNYNLPDHWYLVSAPIMTANFAAKGSDVWTVPLGGGIGKLFKLGQILPLEGHALAKLPINTQIQAFGNVARPEDGPKWQLRFQIQFLFPK